MEPSTVDVVPADAPPVDDDAAHSRTAGSDAGPGAAGDRNPGGPPRIEQLSQLPQWLQRLVVAGGVLAVGLGVVLRFVVHSPLWLDEALTVDIAKLPLKDLHAALKRDGAPPLFYVLEHFWIRLFGSSDFAVRSISGVISVATLPVAWVAARRYGPTAAWVTVLLLASAPFAIFYATESRMYALVMLLTACGYVALDRALRQPRAANLIGLAVVTAALLYTQYWAIYLTAVVGAWLVWQSVRGRDRERSNARWALLATAVGALLFVPWVPTFLYQSAHTGTPWAKPPNFAAIINAVTGFTDNQATNTVAGSNQGRLLALCYFALGALGLFGLARDRWHVDLDLRTRRIARPTALMVVGTLVLAIVGAIVTDSAYSNRYAAVVFVPLLVLVALGSLTLLDIRVRTVVVAVAVVAGLASGVENIWTQRSEAQDVATALMRHAPAGSIVAFCPDQLGPSVYRLVPPGRFTMITYPRGTGPAFVDWVNYQQAIDHAPVQAFVDRLESEARSTGRQVWLVYFTGYQEFGSRCQQIASALAEAPNGARTWVEPNQNEFYEPMQLNQYTVAPAASASSASSASTTPAAVSSGASAPDSSGASPPPASGTPVASGAH